MIFACFRVILIFFSVACLILSCFAITGSYKNENYLTSTYLINFHLDGLDLRQIISTSVGSGSNKIKKRAQDTEATATATATPTTTTGGLQLPSQVNSWIGVATSYINQPGFSSEVAGLATSLGTSIPSSISIPASISLPSGISLPSDLSIPRDASDLTAAIADVLNNVSPQELGIADVYSTSFWGYCRGEKVGNGSEPFDNSLGHWIDKNFDNSNVNYTWCSPPKAGFFFDPLEIFKQEMNRTIDDISVDTQSQQINQLSQQYKTELKLLIDNLSALDLNLPGNLQNDLTLLNNLTTASFALMLITAALSFISIVVQLMACCISPDNCCLSFLNFMFQVLIFLASIIAAGLVTGCYVFVRRKVNEDLGEFGIKSFLSINFYAFAFSAAAAALLVVIFSLLGHCCGMFGSGKRRYRTVQQAPAYEHSSYEEK